MGAVFCEWGLNGIHALADRVDVFVIVDVLSFSTAVDVVVSRGASVYPFPFGDHERAKRAAAELGAILAKPRRAAGGGLSLSPQSLLAVSPGLKLMLPSPNGSRLSLEVSGKTVLAGCLRNARAVAEAAMTCADGGDVAVIAAGERWPDGSLRPAIEDWLGAGSILRHIDLAFSAEAEAARLAYSSAGPDVARLIRSSVRVRSSCNPALDRTWKLLWRRAQAMAFRSCAMERSDNFRL